MATSKIKLTDNWVHLLMSFPESGMGYQIVRVFLKGGKVLLKHKVLNASILILNEGESIKVNDIEKIEMEAK